MAGRGNVCAELSAVQASFLGEYILSSRRDFEEAFLPRGVSLFERTQSSRHGTHRDTMLVDMMSPFLLLLFSKSMLRPVSGVVELYIVYYIRVKPVADRVVDVG